MSLWQPKWKAWCARVEQSVALVNYYSSVDLLRADYGWVQGILARSARETFNDLIAFYTSFQQALPPEAASRLGIYVGTMPELFKEMPDMPDTGGGAIWGPGLIGQLLSVQTEVNHLLQDVAASARKDVERALLHLQRTLVVNESVRRIWRSAFNSREERSEALGAVHLLQHGIWAFKVDGVTGGRTDLVLPGPTHESDVLQSGTTLVLTEWKMVRKGDDPAAKAHEAQQQAERYAGGPLAGVELATHRYVILVSEKDISPLPVLPQTDHASYEVRNIAVHPSSPSVVARTARSRKPRR